jgi:hypothetical protein
MGGWRMNEGNQGDGIWLMDFYTYMKQNLLQFLGWGWEGAERERQ